MDFIEQWFGLSPDGGNGSAELMILIAIVAVILCLAISAVPRWRAALLRYASQYRGPARPRR